MGGRYPLHMALPAEVLAGSGTVWGRYKQYPVFSWPWLRGRSLLFLTVIAALALLAGLGVAVALRDYAAGARVLLLQFTGFALMATSGPAFATWVRHRRWPERPERFGIVVALLLGMVVSFFIDEYTSAAIAEAMKPLFGTPELPQLATAGVRERLLGGAANIVLLVAAYAAFGGGLALHAYFSERRRWVAHRQRRELESLQARARDADLRLGVLQAQVEPHFLFNTLASVRALVRQDPAQAEATLDALAGFLRSTIPRMRDERAALHATLGQQLDICASYLQVMQVRMGGRLRYAVWVEPALREHPFPPALLITLVENAIKHGIEPRPGVGRVDIRVQSGHGRLRIRVIDDGVGLQPGLGSGVGLANVREQLLQRFSGHARLRLLDGAGQGVEACIEIPLQVPA